MSCDVKRCKNEDDFRVKSQKNGHEYQVCVNCFAKILDANKSITKVIHSKCRPLPKEV